ncbi:MAG: hypothetical protein JWM62_1222, partial [Frankiales bacterium]|nr:hypothetical protein [Frankiales bacterium]
MTQPPRQNRPTPRATASRSREGTPVTRRAAARCSPSSRRASRSRG